MRVRDLDVCASDLFKHIGLISLPECREDAAQERSRSDQAEDRSFQADFHIGLVDESVILHQSEIS